MHVTKRLLTIIPLFLLACAAHAEDPGGFEVGLMFSLEPDSNNHFNIRIMPQGKVVTHPSSSSRLEIVPRVSFVLNDEGKFRKVDFEVGQKFRYGPADLGTAPRVIIAENGASWLVVPRSYWLKFNGVGSDMISTIPGKLKAITSAVAGQEPKQEEKQAIIYVPPANLEPCPEDPKYTTPLSGTQLAKLEKLQLTYPEVKTSLTRKEENLVLDLKAKWDSTKQ